MITILDRAKNDIWEEPSVNTTRHDNGFAFIQRSFIFMVNNIILSLLTCWGQKQVILDFHRYPKFGLLAMLALREEPSLNIAAQHEANANYMFSREFFVA